MSKHAPTDTYWRSKDYQAHELGDDPIQVYAARMRAALPGPHQEPEDPSLDIAGDDDYPNDGPVGMAGCYWLVSWLAMEIAARV